MTGDPFPIEDPAIFRVKGKTATESGNDDESVSPASAKPPCVNFRGTTVR